jgi:hypothetical protein
MASAFRPFGKDQYATNKKKVLRKNWAFIPLVYKTIDLLSTE